MLSAGALVGGVSSAAPESISSLSENDWFEWRQLLYYNSPAFFERSWVDTPAFFLGRNGATDFEAEIIADLEALKQPLTVKNEHFRCQFPARARWLTQRFALPNIPLATWREGCPTLSRWFEIHDYSGASLVFSSYYPGNPASLFGHTLLRLKRRAAGADLLDDATNYAALVDSKDLGLTYAVAGLTGGYLGGFALVRYYEMLEQYANIESRDLWEYELDLNPEEVVMLRFRLYETLAARFRYRFLEGNC